MSTECGFRVLLALAVATAVVTAGYNLWGRQPFAVAVHTYLPQTVASSEAEESPSKPVEFPLDLNTAGYDQLVQVPRIGDVTAQRILEHREALGGFESLDQLLEVRGIGEKTYETIAEYLFVGELPPEGADPEKE